mmetsp:Transcript_47624/g.94685  ORF Transcript_47624/g.94685 Transcript_47624/m.94685 type:complete len:222 (-) Transcript_47624:373-1038(-)
MVKVDLPQFQLRLPQKVTRQRRQDFRRMPRTASKPRRPRRPRRPRIQKLQRSRRLMRPGRPMRTRTLERPRRSKSTRHRRSRMQRIPNKPRRPRIQKLRRLKRPMRPERPMRTKTPGRTRRLSLVSFKEHLPKLRTTHLAGDSCRRRRNVRQLSSNDVLRLHVAVPNQHVALRRAALWQRARHRPHGHQRERTPPLKSIRLRNQESLRPRVLHLRLLHPHK